MSKESLAEMIRRWDTVAYDDLLPDGSTSLILYLADKLFSSYEPEPQRPFNGRLEAWLNNVSDDSEKRILFASLLHFFFVGPQEFESLHRSAKSEIERWILETGTTSLCNDRIGEEIDSSLACTWICPITDSLRINSFLKVNRLVGHEKRPDWRSLSAFGDVNKIRKYIEENQIERIVLLEDFVGTGTQSSSTIEWCCTNFQDMNILLCPLIICPKGDRCFSDLEAVIPNLAYRPVLVLPERVFLSRTPSPGENEFFKHLRGLINSNALKLTDPFGYKDTGALIAMFSNCPDNTLSLFRDETASWSPLFSRVWRPE
jgi:hypothetical protein